jgi:predicted N-acetyltransferase YhbS
MPTSADDRLSIDTYRAGDETEILACLERCFGLRRSPTWWHHLHTANPAGPAIVAVVRAGQRVVSHFMVVPHRMQAFGRIGTAGHCIWSMTHPEWQRRGLLQQTGDAALRTATAEGWLASYAFANAQAQPAFIRQFRHHAIPPFPLMIRPLRPVRALLQLLRGRIAQVVERPGVSDEAAPLPINPPAGWDRPAFDARHDRLFQAAADLPPVALVRDAAYLGWRYPTEPDSPYWHRNVSDGSDLAASAVVRVAPQFGLNLAFVMEWHWAAGRRRDGGALMREVGRAGRRAGAHGVAALAMPGTPQRRVLRRLGFIGIPETFFPTTIVLTARPEPEDNPNAWFTPASWYLTFGDGDLL